MKQRIICLIAILLLGSSLFAFGKRETKETPATTLDSWLETVDVSQNKAGKYNILITAEDLAGNQALAGPYNIYLDPESDLPVTRITNPLNDMRVPGNLNIVGTAIDDDAIDYVEIILDGEAAVRASGKEFWSYYLDTTTLSEGSHIISVYAVDVFGVQGRPYTVVWNLDRNRPETLVDNRAMGSLVSGRFSLTGAVTDGNGIERLSYSLDNGQIWQAITLKHDKKQGIWTFQVSIDSTKIEDGPSVCWFKAEDLQGSEGIYTFLYFVDNTKPSVDFISPAPLVGVNGVFSVSGFARDINGIASLSWKAGKETGTFELVRGNPYWIKEFDITGYKDKTFEVEITATDTAGNKTSVTRKIPVDLKADIPVLALDPLEKNAAGLVEVDSSLYISGFAADDDGIASVVYSLDKAAPVTVETTGGFGFDLLNLTPGKHSLELWPVDTYGTRGPSTVIQALAKGQAPSISVLRPVSPSAPLDSEGGLSLSVKIASEAGLQAVQTQVGGLSEKAEKIKTGATSAEFAIPVSPDFPYGIVALTITATDLFGRQTIYNDAFQVINLSIPHGPAPESVPETLSGNVTVTIPASGKIPASTGTATAAIERLLPKDEAFTQGITVVLDGPGYPKEGRTDSAVLVGMDSPIPVVSVTWTLNGTAGAKITPKKTGETRYEALIPLSALLKAGWATLDVKVALRDGTEIPLSGLMSIVRREPAAGINDSEQLVWINPVRSEAGAMLLPDGSNVRAVYNAKVDRRAASVAFSPAVSGLEASLEGNEVVVRAVKDGEYQGVKLAVTDTEGAVFTSAPFTVIADTALPELSVEVPGNPAWLANAMPVKISASDSFGLKKVEYSFTNGASWTALQNFKGSFEGKLDISAIPDGKLDLLVQVTDLSGRLTQKRAILNKDTVSPKATVVFPVSGDVVNGETLIGFSVEDAGVLASAEYLAKSVPVPLALSSLVNTFVGTADKPLEDDMRFRFTDAAGNSSVVDMYQFFIDANADLPVVEIHVPAENEVIIKNFVVSGVVYDDDKPAKVHYRVDSLPWKTIDVESSFSIPFALADFTDNEHTITVYAEDIHGVRGNDSVRKIRVSLEEPKASVDSPSFDTTNSKLIDILGKASDKNGIERVEISLDNGNTFNLAEGTTNWKYRFDSRVIQDGTHVVFVRVYDSYGITGLYSSLINIDNTAPSIRLELPLDGSRTASTLFISGQTLDNIYLERVSAKISNIEAKQPAIPASLSEIPFENSLIISAGVDISALPEGFYNIEVRGFDRAGNVTRISRNFEVYRGIDRNRIEFLYPMNGEKVHGLFNIYGRVLSEDPVSNLLLYVNNADVAFTEMTPSGYFMFSVTPDMISEGLQSVRVRALVEGDKIIESEERVIRYQADGPWITVDNFVMGDFAIERPWLEGKTGYSFTEEEVLALKDKETSKEQLRVLQEKSLDRVDISFDNGKTFLPTESGRKWRYRLETGELAEGYHFMIVRATMKNGEVAVSRSIIQVDKTAPSVRLISPGEGGMYNNELVFSGLSSDDVQLDSITLALRSGDKSAYAVPSFIQGLYFDWHFWGATLYDIGVGFTFFDDNVKLQGQFGQFTAEQRALFTDGMMRYGGNVFGLKLLANLAFVPMDFFLGPDFSWLSASGAVGANFSVFTDTQSGVPQILSALLLQGEFPRITLAKRKTFRTFSLYAEAQFWFIPTDVDSSEVKIQSILPHLTGGARLNLF